MLNARDKDSQNKTEIKPKFTREQTFEFFKELKGEETSLLIEAVKNGMIDQIKRSQDATASEQFMAIQQARSFDKLAIEKNVSESDYLDALGYYKVDS